MNYRYRLWTLGIMLVVLVMVAGALLGRVIDSYRFDL